MTQDDDTNDLNPNTNVSDTEEKIIANKDSVEVEVDMEAKGGSLSKVVLISFGWSLTAFRGME